MYFFCKTRVSLFLILKAILFCLVILGSCYMMWVWCSWVYSLVYVLVKSECSSVFE